MVREEDEESGTAAAAAGIAEGVPACWGVDDVSSSESSSQLTVSVGDMAAPRSSQLDQQTVPI